MKSIVYIVLLSNLFGLLLAAQNLRPIIGVLSQPASGHLANLGSSFIVADYVKWLESAGARVAVIHYEQTPEQLNALFDSLNGVLFTGGGQELYPNQTYFQAANLFYQRALEANKKGDYFPLWGTCMGFQLMCILAANDTSVLQEYAFDSENLGLPIDLTPSGARSRMFANAPKEVMTTLTTRPATQNLHHDGVDPGLFDSNAKLAAVFDLLSTNVDRKQKPFASTMEGKAMPFYATQWHPERNAFEFDLEETSLDHHPDAIVAMQYVANFFVQETRKNAHKFPSPSAEFAASIYRYAPAYTGDLPNYPEAQTYVFK